MVPLHRRDNHLHNFIVFTELSKDSNGKSPAFGENSPVTSKNVGTVLAASIYVPVLLFLMSVLSASLSGARSFSHRL